MKNLTSRKNFLEKIHTKLVEEQYLDTNSQIVQADDFDADDDFEYLNEKTSGEIFDPTRNKPVVFDIHDVHDSEFTEEMFNLINVAYSSIGGHLKIKTFQDLVSNPNWNFWQGVDIHDTNDFDLILFGKKTKYGLKFIGMGHDGQQDSKSAVLNLQSDSLHKLGFYLEVCGKLAEILIKKYNAPIVEDPEVVKKVLGKDIEWKGTVPGHSGNGWYSRQIADDMHDKIMLGRPII